MGAAGQPHGSAAHRAGFAAVATLAGAVVLVLVASGSFAQRAEVLLQDDVTHDGAIGDLFNGHGRVPRGARGRQHGGGALSKDASVSDFFKAALNGDFSKGGTVKDATSGIFDNSRTHPGTQRARRRRESRELKAPHRAREQALAETKLRIKAAHAALAAEAHADRSPPAQMRVHAPAPVFSCGAASHMHVSLRQTCAAQPARGREGGRAARGFEHQGGADARDDKEKRAEACAKVPIRGQVRGAVHWLCSQQRRSCGLLYIRVLCANLSGSSTSCSGRIGCGVESKRHCGVFCLEGSRYRIAAPLGACAQLPAGTAAQLCAARSALAPRRGMKVLRAYDENEGDAFSRVRWHGRILWQFGWTRREKMRPLLSCC